MKVELSRRHTLSCMLMVFFSGIIWMTFQARRSSAVPPPYQFEEMMPMRTEAHQDFQQGNFKDAYESFRKLILGPKAEPRLVADDLHMAVQCLLQLNRAEELDALLEAAVAAHKDNWRLLSQAARSYMEIPHHGFLVAGEFHRGEKRGGGKMVNAYERDRIRALQLMVQAMPLAVKDEKHVDTSDFFLQLADIFLSNRERSTSWRLQELSDLSILPDYEEQWYSSRRRGGAPVDAEGRPVFHHLPKSFEAAQSDGERWRWCLQQAVEFDRQKLNIVRLRFAQFLREQFGVETLAEWGWRFGRDNVDDTREDESGTYALHTLAETETIARLATGIKRFELPEEFNYIKIFQQVAAEPQEGHAIEALEQLAQIFENRRQYAKAADCWRRLISDYSVDAERRKGWLRRLEQIEGNWGRFEPARSQPAEKAPTLEYRFRNGRAVELTAHEINIEKLLGDIKAYLKSNPSRLDWRKLEIGNLGYRLIEENEKQYVGRKVAQWRLRLEPREKHFDKRVTISTPLQKPGAYLVTAKMEGGNTCFIVLWVDDTAIVRKTLSGSNYYFVADAVSGKPIPRANVEFLGWKHEFDNRRRRSNIVVKNFAEYTDEDGQIVLSAAAQPPDMGWLAIARTGKGRLAFLGFSHVWYGVREYEQYDAVKVYAVTDRPVYRPKQEVHYKFWVRRAKYDMPDTSEFAGQTFSIEILDPKGECVERKTLQADAYGGLEGLFSIPADAALGSYALAVKSPDGKQSLGGGDFRVEEYKKPEFEVTIEAPTEPVMLGEKITATIKAAYYFGSPVSKAKVRYTVNRTEHDGAWYPPGPWDWLYGPGYWWFAYDYHWYPGWQAWGCRRPLPFWWPRMPQPPELVAEQETQLNPDGTLNVDIDTATAKLLHPDQDHTYTITAEVVDQSRRTIVGTGTVLAARKPFAVNVWVNKGYYQTGETILAHACARTPNGKPVQAHGELDLLRIHYRDGKPRETVVQSWQVATDAEGRLRQQLSAAQAGQYRLRCKLTDAAEHTIEGGYVFTVIGSGYDGSEFRFNHLELIPEKTEYQPGEKVRLQINTNYKDGTVLLFLRPTHGVYSPPKILRMQGKSTVEEIPVEKGDMPNFFVEAVIVADGRMHSEVREIVVPPEKRVLNVELQPNKDAYKPGEKATVKLKLTDFNGAPFVGSTVVAVYDKALEYISGGSNVPDIKEFFWRWRRYHEPAGETNLARWSLNLIPPKTEGMNDIGLFGGSVPEEMDELLEDNDDRFAADGAPREVARSKLGGMKMEAAGRGDIAHAPLMAAAEAEEAPAGESPEAQLVQPSVRSKFADTVLWVGALETAADGTAEVALNMPDNLTTWRIKVWGMGHGTRVGQGFADVVTRKDLIVRLQAPRFFLQKDEVVLSAVVHNYLKSKKNVRVSLELEGPSLRVVSPPEGEAVQSVEIEPNGEARVDWRVQVLDEGEAVVRMKALTDEESDAMEQRFTCYIHGMLKMDAYSGVIRPRDERGEFTINVPRDRRPPQTRLEVRYSPTLAGAMIDALPYLVDYPYGCTEQTLNRFLPTVITQKVLLDMKLDLKEIERKRTNLNAQELGDAAARARQWKRAERNPVFDEDEVRRMVKEGVQALTEMQCADGGWGWFSGWNEHSSPHTTAIVVHGLQIARQNDVALVPGVLERGITWLKRYQDRQVKLLKNAQQENKPSTLEWKSSADNLDALVYMVLVDADIHNAEMCEFLYRDRTQLSVYAMAMFGLALEKEGQKDKLAMILRNIGQYVEQDEENQTAWLRLPEGYWWYWYGSEFEAHAYYLKLLARTDPRGELAPRLVKYLLNNRKHATYWNSTRDTALCVEAFADFIRAAGEDRPEMTVEVYYDGKLQKAVEITPQNLFFFDNRFVFEGEAVSPGRHVIELRKHGTGPLYYNGYLTNFTLEDFIKKAGLEIKVERKYFRLVRAEKSITDVGSRGQVVEREVEKYVREELPNDAQVRSGDLVEIELEIQSKNDYEYLVFEDPKPAGFEPVDLRSGYTGNELRAYVEFRDNRVVFFVRNLARGKHSVSYRLRAEIPGRFSALPTRAWAMYAPELKANSDELKLEVRD